LWPWQLSSWPVQAPGGGVPEVSAEVFAVSGKAKTAASGRWSEGRWAFGRPWAWRVGSSHASTGMRTALSPQAGSSSERERERENEVRRGERREAKLKPERKKNATAIACGGQ
jgi:hypothetical protein